ncbi:MAG: holin family protein [Synergistaceae bacterium]|jgi:hypothetical protein|nr:holin family protein [Synergistaceae bacterium]
MAGVLDLIPEVGKLIDRFVPDPQKKLEAERMMRELDIREIEARAGVQKAWLSNNSLFVSGAIPTILWMVSLVIFFNHILAPLFGGFGIVVPTLELPPWYSSLAGTIVLGLLGKKAWDSTELNWHGETIKGAKEKVQAEIETPKTQSPVAPVEKNAKSPTDGRADATQFGPPEGVTGEGGTPPYDVDARLRELCREKGIEP